MDGSLSEGDVPPVQTHLCPVRQASNPADAADEPEGPDEPQDPAVSESPDDAEDLTRRRIPRTPSRRRRSP